MSAYYGGRPNAGYADACPVVYCDFLSMYPTVNTLMGFWDHVTPSGSTSGRHRTDPPARANIDLDDCLDPATWRNLPALVQIKPAGDVLPVRARYDGTNWNIGSNPLWADEPLWYALPDVIASKLITGKAPTDHPGATARAQRPTARTQTGEAPGRGRGRSAQGGLLSRRDRAPQGAPGQRGDPQSRSR